ncbi:MAG: RluA family pseudouridine synthase [Chitinivibrionales bacterium]|nr:RluA family pseudouridine synthase [Chitinivibrionales bacterium]
MLRNITKAQCHIPAAAHRSKGDVMRADQLHILHEDDDMIVVDKPEGLATIPERFDREHCLLNYLAESVPYKPYVVHRIDKPVSGAVIFAKNADSHRYLCTAFEQGRVEKTYLALVHGKPIEEQGTIDYPLRRFGSGRMGVDSRRGKQCRTEFTVLEECGQYAHLRVSPRTGRRHQIRVHLYSIGHPIVGDSMYGSREIQERFARLMLHASQISLRMADGHEVSVSSPLPASYQTLLTQAREASLDSPGLHESRKPDAEAEAPADQKRDD